MQAHQAQQQLTMQALGMNYGDMQGGMCGGGGMQAMQAMQAMQGMQGMLGGLGGMGLGGMGGMGGASGPLTGPMGGMGGLGALGPSPTAGGSTTATGMLPASLTALPLAPPATASLAGAMAGGGGAAMSSMDALASLTGSVLSGQVSFNRALPMYEAWDLCKTDTGDAGFGLRWLLFAVGQKYPRFFSCVLGTFCLF
jgi:hypothetical protein